VGPTLAPDDLRWLTRQLRCLKHAGPEPLLTALHQQVAVQAQPPPPEVSEALAYLDKRVAQLQYPAFRAQGWPIGSGIVESANKPLVEARLKGAGMHWARPNVTPLLVLRNAACNDRWDAMWVHSALAPPPRAAALPRSASAPPSTGAGTASSTSRSAARSLWALPPAPNPPLEAPAHSPAVARLPLTDSGPKTLTHTRCGRTTGQAGYTVPVAGTQSPSRRVAACTGT
jgi:hypothetical protein